MFGKKMVATLIAGVASIALPAFAQSEEPARNEVSVQAFGSFLKNTTDNGIQNSATNSGGVLGSYRYFFGVHHGVEANYGYALNTQNFVSSSGALGVNNYSHEVSAAYVFRLPLKRFTPFVTAGAGALVSIPKIFRKPIRRRVPHSFMAAEPISTSHITFSCVPSIEALSIARQPTI